MAEIGYTFNLVAERASFVMVEHNVLRLELLGAPRLLSRRRRDGGGGEARGTTTAVSRGMNEA